MRTHVHLYTMVVFFGLPRPTNQERLFFFGLAPDQGGYSPP